MSLGTFFGTDPRAATAPAQTTVSPAQSSIQNLIANTLSQILSGTAQPGITATPPVVSVQAGQPAFGAPTGGVYAAPVTPGQTTDINAIQGATGPGSLSSNVNQQAANALTQILSGQPQDYSQYFKTSVAGPFEDVFTNQTLPAIKAAFARSAGGTYSGSDATGGGAGTTGYQGAVTTATKDVNRQLNEAQTSLVTQAIQSALQRQTQGVAIAPGTAAAPIDQLITALQAQTVPQATQQTQISGQQNQFNTAIAQLIQLLGGGAGFSTAPTITSANITGVPGSPGILGEIIAAAGSAAGKGAFAG